MSQVIVFLIVVVVAALTAFGIQLRRQRREAAQACRLERQVRAQRDQYASERRLLEMAQLDLVLEEAVGPPKRHPAAMGE